MEQNHRDNAQVHGFYAQSLPGRHSSKWRSYQVLIDKIQAWMEL